MEHALKVLRPNLAKDAEFRDRFMRETRTTARLSHPSIGPIFDSGEERGLLYLVMPFIRGTDLRRMLGRTDRPSLPLLLQLLRQAAPALDAAHSEGVVHRALKPENVLVQLREGQSPRVHLVDFAMTRHVGGEPLNKLQEGLSTLTYMAPEQINRTDIDGRADVYSLGCMLYECLAGRPPFQRDTEGAMLYAHLVEPPPRVTGERHDLPEDIDEVVLRAMDKHRGRRFMTCRALVAEAMKALGPVAYEDHPEAAPSRATGIGVHAPASGPGQRPQDGVDTISMPPPFPAPRVPTLPRPPKRRGRRRVVLWATAAVVLWGAIIGGALGLSAESGHRFPRAAVQSFMDACTSQATVSVCGCEITRIQERFSLHEFRSLLQEFSRSGTLPAALTGIARECGDVTSAGPGA
jgi:serine/threonine protein kinase